MQILFFAFLKGVLIRKKSFKLKISKYSLFLNLINKYNHFKP